MLAVPDLEAIFERLDRLSYEQWGPDDVRYVCILFWDYLGYRQLDSAFEVADWERWSRSSGEFWDLFLAGCYMNRPSDFYGSKAEVLASKPQPDYTQYFYWNQAASELLAAEVARLAEEEGTLKPWSFGGPIELVAVGARRSENGGAYIDWPSLRGIPIRANDLPIAVGSYTEAHVTLDADDVPPEFPRPGDFEDDVWTNLKRQILHTVPGLAKAVVKAHHLL